MPQKLCAALLGLLLLSSSFSKAQSPTISYEMPAFISGLSVPVDLVNAGDGSNRLFIVQQSGIILVRQGTSPFAVTEFLNLGPSPGSNRISYTAGGERGLLSMAFHPNYDGVSNRYFFVYYTEINTGRVVVRRYETAVGNKNLVDTTTNLLIMAIDHPGQSNHNGGKLNFGPDGYLYFATGDGGGGNDVPNNAQNGNSLLGKMIRIDVNAPVAQTFGNYVIPSDNPYVSDGAILDEIWALGLRNPFRWSFDRNNWDMWIGDVGQNAREEVNYRPAGSTGHINYGWRCFEGTISTPGVADCTPTDNVFPIFDYVNPTVGRTVIGGYVYRGNEFPTLRGRYLTTDASSGIIFLIWPNGSGGWNNSSQAGTAGIVGFGEAEDGTLYAVSQGSNSILKVSAAGGVALPVTLSSFTAKHFDRYNELKWTTSTESKTARFVIEYSVDARNFTRAGSVAASRNPNGSNYSFRHLLTTGGEMYYRLAIEDDDGSIRYSSILKLPGENGIVKIYPTVIQNSTLNISLSKPGKKLQLINSNGAVVFEKNLENLAGSSAINLPLLARGMYMARITLMNEVKQERIVIQ